MNLALGNRITFSILQDDDDYMRAFWTSVFFLHPYIYISSIFSHSLFLFFSCGLRLELQSLKYMYAMAFAVEEINRHSTLLPGVKLGYRIVDSCGRYPWALQAALSLVGGDTGGCSSTASTPASHEQPGEAGMT